MEMLFQAHSGLRYLVLLAGVVAVVAFVAGALSRRPYGRPGRILTAVFLATLDLQVLIGLVLFIGGRRPTGIHLHMTMMILAAVVAHVASVLAKRRVEPGHALPLAGTLAALALIVVGILSIRDSVF